MIYFLKCENWLIVFKNLFCRFGVIFLLYNAPAACASEPVLVLGSGGTKGMAHVGALEELENLDIRPRTIIGCSAGALVGALYAQNLDIHEVKNILINLRRDDFLNFSLFTKGAVSKRNKIERFLDQYLVIDDFQDLPIELVIVATDFETGESVYFSEGSIKDAVLASSCLPGLFQPYEINGRRYIDGGLSDPLPAKFGKALDQGKVIAVDISVSIQSLSSDNIVSILRKSFEIIYHNLGARSHEYADLLLQLNFADVASPIDDSRIEEMYERGKEIVLERAEQIVQLCAD